MASEGDTGPGGTSQEQPHTPQPLPPGSGSFHHGTGSAGEQRPEQPLLSDEERADLVDIAQDSPLASQRLSARRALLEALVHWRVMKQKVVAKSSAEAELIALADHSDMVLTAERGWTELATVPGTCDRSVGT